MQIKIFSKIEDFLLIKDDWDRLFAIGNYSVFQEFSFNYLSWKHELINDKRNQLAITAIIVDNDISSIFPFYLDSKKNLRFINDRHFDFCDCISKDSFNFLEVYNYLRNEISFKSMRLINIKKEAFIYKVVDEASVKNKVFLPISEYSELDVDKGDFPYNVPHYRSHQKHRINKAIRKNLLKDSMILTKKNNHHFPMQDILMLKNKMIHSGIRKKNFLNNNRLLLIEGLYNEGIVCLHVMKGDEGFNSVNVLLKGTSNGFMFWIDIFDEKQMINLSSYCNVIKYFSSLESINVNFGRGRYFYKESNFAPEFYTLYQVLLFSNRFQKISFFVADKLMKKLMSVYKIIKK
tara:strand:+ start:2368 stop:3411 length:1044 start_codon:yes stop_codon:yes gene_type:complete